MSLPVILLVFFIIGFSLDILGAYYLRLVNESKLYMATFISFIHGLLGWAIWGWFMVSLKSPEITDGFQILVYGLGGAIGTYIGLRKPLKT